MKLLSYKLASLAVKNVLTRAADQNWNVAVAVCDAHGDLVCFGRSDNVSPQANLLAQNKAYTSARDRQRSGDLGAWARETGKDMGYWTDSRITGIAGGVPIFQDDTVIGAIGVSGLSESEDETLATDALAEVLSKN